ncbi:MAG: hypothetical protein IKL79_03290 [Clostridia bacterium]|nr:hypothetical protein [Clostridia bacterium]MBR3681011.1 hypothetical protein [Clostridia bacterium]
MITVEYILTPAYGEWKSISGRGSAVELVLGEGTCGIVMIGPRRVEIQNGRGSFSTKGMGDGHYTPYLITERGELLLEPLIITGERITPAPTVDKIHRISLSRIRALEGEIKEIKERTNELYALIKGNALFG